MAKGNSTNTVVLGMTWLGIVIFLSQGWLSSTKSWIQAHTSSSSDTSNTASESGGAAATGPVTGSGSAALAVRTRDALKSAGFSGDALATMLAIGTAESSLVTTAQHTNSDGSIDRGVFQINNRWHPEVSDACAYDLSCSAQQVYRISNGGKSFSPWSTYTSGAFKKYLQAAQAIAGIEVSATV